MLACAGVLADMFIFLRVPILQVTMLQRIDPDVAYPGWSKNTLKGVCSVGLHCGSNSRYGSWSTPSLTTNVYLSKKSVSGVYCKLFGVLLDWLVGIGSNGRNVGIGMATLRVVDIEGGSVETKRSAVVEEQICSSSSILSRAWDPGKRLDSDAGLLEMCFGASSSELGSVSLPEREATTSKRTLPSVPPCLF